MRLSDETCGEVETALRSPATRVIPALVHGAQMPSADQLPDSLRELSLRNAIELSDGRWSSDVDRLIRVLEGRRAEDDDDVAATTPQRTAAPTPAPFGCSA